MRIDFHGLVFETPQVTFHLWSPWRATTLEQRLFEVIAQATHTEAEDGPDERRIRITEPRAYRTALSAVARVLKGWQEDADPHSERRSWRWLLEGDSDADGYDHNGEPTTLWGFIRVGLDRGSPGEPEKGEDIDLEGFGLRIWGEGAGRGEH